MAAILKRHEGDTPAKLSDVLGTTKKHFRQFTLFGEALNAALAYLGPSTVLADGTDRVTTLSPGVGITLGPQGSDRAFIVDTEALYVVAAAGESVDFVVNTDDGGK